MTLAVLADGKKLAAVSVTGPTSYSSPFYVRLEELSKVEQAVSADVSGGYKAEASAVTSNQVGVKVYWQTGVSGAPLAEVAAGTDLSAEKISVVALGW